MNLLGRERVLLKEGTTLRAFVYWVGADVDIIGTFYDDDFRVELPVLYTTLKSEPYQAVKSEDVKYAPEGDHEYIDVTLDAYEPGERRYLIVSAKVYRGGTFNDMEKVLAGFSTRAYPKAGDTHDLELAQHTIEVLCECNRKVLYVFDLKTREAIIVNE